jgi:hypothetical protein
VCRWWRPSNTWSVADSRRVEHCHGIPNANRIVIVHGGDANANADRDTGRSDSDARRHGHAVTGRHSNIDGSNADRVTDTDPFGNAARADSDAVADSNGNSKNHADANTGSDADADTNACRLDGAAGYRHRRERQREHGEQWERRARLRRL